MSDRSNINNGSSAYYLEKLGNRFDKLEAFSTAGDIRPPYPYQWCACTKLRDGEEDYSEGIGGSPTEALRDLWNVVKETPPTQREDEAK